jgi:hypothetical protein
MIGWLSAAAGWLPAIFWVFYTLWNTALPEPPAVGRLTPINLLYLLMLPATLIMALRWTQTRMDGQWAYAGFLVWLILGIVWHNPAPDSEVIKALFICSLALPIAAQILIGGRQAQIVFATAVTLTAAAVSTWMVVEALASGFQYRTGTLLNQNFVATMVAPGLLIALACYLQREDDRLRRTLLGLVLLCGYASLLLGSRGVLIGEIVAAGVLLIRVRPAWRQTRGLVVGTAVVVVMAQLPMIPNALWHTGWRVAATLSASVSRATPATASSPRGGTAGAASGPSASEDTTTASAMIERPLDPRAAESTALGRFVERDTGTLNKRAGLWRALTLFTITQPSILLFGGGLGISGVVAFGADPVFHNAHNTYLQLFADTGLVGVGLLGWVVWRIMRRLATRSDGASALSLAWLAVLIFWLVAGLTSTVIDLHVFWVSLGVAMASTALQAAPGRRGNARRVSS